MSRAEIEVFHTDTGEPVATVYNDHVQVHATRETFYQALQEFPFDDVTLQYIEGSSANMTMHFTKFEARYIAAKSWVHYDDTDWGIVYWRDMT